MKQPLNSVVSYPTEFFYCIFGSMNPAAQYILQQPEPQRAILLHLQLTIEAIVPDAVLLYRYKIPFYYIEGKRPFCYLNATTTYVDLGFWNGAHLEMHSSKLITEGRKHMKSLRYFQLNDLDDIILSDVLMEAYRKRDLKYYN